MAFKKYVCLSLIISCEVMLGILLIVAAPNAQVMTRINLHSAASVLGPTVYLKEIAQIQTTDAELRRKLEQIQIEPAPLVGQTRWIMPDQVRRCLKQNGMDGSQYQVSASGPTKVTRIAVPLKADKIRKAVKSYIHAYAPWKPEQLTIGAIKFNQDVQVPTGKVTLTVKTPKHSDWLGAVPFQVEVKVNGRLIRNITVPVNLEVWSDVVLAAKPLGKYQPIRRDAIKVQRMNLARVPASAIINMEEVIGQRAKRNIAVNSILRNDQIEMLPVVQRGDMVQAVAESSSLKISVQAMVKENGGKGEIIRVLNLRSKKIVYAQVVDAQTVSVDFQRR